MTVEKTGDKIKLLTGFWDDYKFDDNSVDFKTGMEAFISYWERNILTDIMDKRLCNFLQQDVRDLIQAWKCLNGEE